MFDKHSDPALALTYDNTYLSEPNFEPGGEPTEKEVVGRPSRRKSVLKYLMAATSENTQRAYRADLRHFFDWGGTIPADPNLIAEYLAEHAQELAVSTLTRRLAAISKAHATQGHESPTKSSLVRTVMKGVKRTHGQPPHQKAPVLKEHVIAMVECLGGTSRDIRDRGLLLIGFAGGFRRSELVGLVHSDIEWSSEGVIVTLRRSKCDQEGRGRQVAIPYAKGDICPVEALVAWLTVARIKNGPVFRAVDRHGNVADRRLSPEAVALVVKERAEAAGMDAKTFSGHSLRAGLATSAAAAGVASWKIRQQTGHASETMLQRYIRNGDRFAQNAAESLF